MKLGPPSGLAVHGETEVRPSCESSSLFQAGKASPAICVGCLLLFIVGVFTKVETFPSKLPVANCKISAT